MTNVARRIWDVVEPIAANIYFAPEVHAAYHEIGFDPSTRSAGKVQFPEMVAYFTSRGACLGLYRRTLRRQILCLQDRPRHPWRRSCCA